MTAVRVGALDTLGVRVTLSCGHTLSLPWGVPPEAVLADLLHHENVCEREPDFPFYGAFAPGSSPPTPSSEARA